MKLINEIQTARCLVLDKRIDLFDELYIQCYEKLNISIKPFYVGEGNILPKECYGHIDQKTLPPIFPNSVEYPTWYTRTAVYDAHKSHRKIFESVLNDGYENVLMLEDDSFIEEDFEEVLAKTTDFFSSNDWDAIYLGCFHNDPQKITDNIYRVKNTGGLHGVILKANIVRELLTYEPLGPFDHIMGKYIQPKYKCFAVYPNIISQRDGFSFVEGETQTKPSRFKK